MGVFSPIWHHIYLLMPFGKGKDKAGCPSCPQGSFVSWQEEFGTPKGN
jgi:hypothetical protein